MAAQQEPWVFRTRQLEPGGRWPWIAECRRGPFVMDSALTEPAHHEIWFEFGATKDEALSKLRREVLQ